MEINKELRFENGRISLMTSQTSCKLYFYGDIVSSAWDKWGNDDKCPQDVADLLNAIPNDAQLDIYINSGGGDVHAGIAIYQQLKRRSGQNIVHVDGLAASIASVIAMAGDDIIIPASAQMMIHRPWTMAMGDADDLRKTADALDMCQTSILEIYMTKTLSGVDRATVENMMNAETWMTGTEAAKIFDVTVDDVPAAAACVSDYFKKYRNTPGLDTIGGTLVSCETAAMVKQLDAMAKQIQAARMTVISPEDLIQSDGNPDAEEIERMRVELALMDD